MAKLHLAHLKSISSLFMPLIAYHSNKKRKKYVQYLFIMSTILQTEAQENILPNPTVLHNLGHNLRVVSLIQIYSVPYKYINKITTVLFVWCCHQSLDSCNSQGLIHYILPVYYPSPILLPARFWERNGGLPNPNHNQERGWVPWNKSVL